MITDHFGNKGNYILVKAARYSTRIFVKQDEDAEQKTKQFATKTKIHVQQAALYDNYEKATRRAVRILKSKKVVEEAPLIEVRYKPRIPKS